MTQQQLMEIIKDLTEASSKARSGLLALFSGKTKAEIKQMLRGLAIDDLKHIVTYVGADINDKIMPAVSELIINKEAEN